MPSSTSYANWHRNVGLIFLEVTGQHCQLTQRPREARVRSFELSSAASQTIIDRIDRQRGGRTSAIPLLPHVRFDAPTVWVSWFEEWREVALGRFKLEGMSATFYWGIAGRRRLQLLRAEWASYDRAPATSAQPHWQVDTDFIGDRSVVQEPTGEQMPEGARDELVELPPYTQAQDGISIVSISRLHLGMAGWRNAATFPGWWRVELGQDEVLRREWLHRTLQHAADQFEFVTVA
jgi:hypothetical protein